MGLADRDYMRRDYNERNDSKENPINFKSFKYRGRPIPPYQANSGVLVEKKSSKYKIFLILFIIIFLIIIIYLITMDSLNV